MLGDLFFSYVRERAALWLWKYRYALSGSLARRKLA